MNVGEGMCCWGGYDRVGSGQWDIIHYIYVRISQEYIKKIVLRRVDRRLRDGSVVNRSYCFYRGT